MAKRLPGQQFVAFTLPSEVWKCGVDGRGNTLKMYIIKIIIQGILQLIFDLLHLSLLLVFLGKGISILRNPFEPLSGPTRSAHLLCHRSIKPLKINWLLQKRCKVPEHMRILLHVCVRLCVCVCVRKRM